MSPLTTLAIAIATISTVNAYVTFSPSSGRTVLRYHSMAPRVMRPRGSALRMGWGDDVVFSTAKVISNEPAAEGMRAITVEAGDDILGAYTIPGQFVQIKESEDTKPGFFAIASAPGATPGQCELLIKLSEGSDWAPGNQWLCGSKAGETLIMSPAMGSGFKMEEKFSETGSNDFPVQDVLLFAAGSGISPIRSAIESGALAGKSCTLYYGARSSSYMAYMDKFDEWEQQGVKVIPVMSQAESGWGGRTGYVQAALKEDGVKVAKNTGALMCGMKGMAEDVKEALVEGGVDEERVLTNF